MWHSETTPECCSYWVSKDASGISRTLARMSWGLTLKRTAYQSESVSGSSSSRPRFPSFRRRRLAPVAGLRPEPNAGGVRRSNAGHRHRRNRQARVVGPRPGDGAVLPALPTNGAENRRGGRRGRQWLAGEGLPVRPRAPGVGLDGVGLRARRPGTGTTRLHAARAQPDGITQLSNFAQWSNRPSLARDHEARFSRLPTDATTSRDYASVQNPSSGLFCLVYLLLMVNEMASLICLREP